ncbi:Hsp70-binding protein [Acrasis kona]|uniref:Nucleotide exchange factor SIL1 n=1 Tax=Acrasis kona TaxID=1008807 RepID=A0AAW2ZD85_9EUKA
MLNSNSKGLVQVEQEQNQNTRPQQMNPPRFNTIDDLLHWGIENSDPEVLRQLAQTQRSDIDVEESKAKIKWLNEQMAQFNMDHDLTRRAGIIIEKLNNDLSFDETLDLWIELSDLVEDIDVAVDFTKLGGLDLVGRKLQANGDMSSWSLEDLEVTEAVANVLGVCSQNNPEVQGKVAQHQSDFIVKILENINQLSELQKNADASAKELFNMRQRLLKKYLFALSCLLSANINAIQSFVQKPNAVKQIVSLLSLGTKDVRVKILFLLNGCLSVEIENNKNDLIRQLEENKFTETLFNVLKESIELNQYELVEKSLNMIQELTCHDVEPYKTIKKHIVDDGLMKKAGIEDLKQKILTGTEDRGYLDCLKDVLAEIKL